jgi:hypothetical protein
MCLPALGSEPISRCMRPLAIRDWRSCATQARETAETTVGRDASAWEDQRRHVGSGRRRACNIYFQARRSREERASSSLPQVAHQSWTENLEGRLWGRRLLPSQRRPPSIGLLPEPAAITPAALLQLIHAMHVAAFHTCLLPCSNSGACWSGHCAGGADAALRTSRCRPRLRHLSGSQAQMPT